MIKVLAGGGGRGMRMVRSADQIDKAYRQCAAEAQLGFGDPAVFAEAHLDDARHIEAQVVAAPDGHVTRALALGDSDCSIQRRYQKTCWNRAGSVPFNGSARELHRAAARLCSRVGYRGLATVEFLVTGDDFVFLEVNPRIQVERTLTERSLVLTWWLCSSQSPVARRSTSSACHAGSFAKAAKWCGNRRRPTASRSRAGSTWRLGRRRVGASGRGHPVSVIPAERTWSARRQLRPGRADSGPAVRLAAGQGDHSCARFVIPHGVA